MFKSILEKSGFKRKSIPALKTGRVVEYRNSPRIIRASIGIRTLLILSIPFSIPPITIEAVRTMKIRAAIVGFHPVFI